jgi:hypothetical protein
MDEIFMLVLSAIEVRIEHDGSGDAVDGLVVGACRIPDRLGSRAVVAAEGFADGPE